MMDTETKQAKRKENFAKLDEAIAARKGERGALMPVLQEAQAIFGYVPQDVQIRIANGLGVPLTEVYGVSTFYSQFALEEQGRHIIGLCLGTACYVRGAQKILDRLSSELDCKVGHTTKDGAFTLNATRCLGACGLAPVMMIDDEVYGRLTPGEVPGILAKYKDQQAS
ncbi:MAG: NADH-quinone oxidoreductase subunit NuoE [Oscillospiraceae bacterium]|jgi:NADH:ubiquinone oxidoreductase subunit E|nr:NADH-quinone oxidoreductase subunit NuoE [Oscillospiraceae bacterium]